MLTVIYCTRKTNPEHKKHLIKSSGINKDIEVIEIINNGESLTKAYNRGLKQAKNDIVVFCHDDINIKSKNWGVRLINHFKDTDYGILGVAGTTSLSESGRWWDNPQFMVGNVEHRHEGKTWLSKYSKNVGENIIETVIVDGLFFAVNKNKLKHDFDETVSGFHFYDVDFSFRNHVAGVKVGVVSNVRVLHKSIGMTNEEWEKNRVSFSAKWSDKLPTVIQGDIFYEDIKIQIKKQPKLGIIILNKSNNDLLFKCLTSIIDKTKYENYKIYIGDTGSSEDELKEINNFIGDNNKISLHNIGVYNFGRNNNKIVKTIIDNDTELLLFSNNDIELINDSISIMVQKYVSSKNIVGTIGCRLHYPNKLIQHAGISMMVNKANQFWVSHVGINSFYRYGEDEEVVGSTGAFLMISKILFNNIGGFNENYLDCFEDVELNVNALILNKKNYIMTSAVCYHHESVTRNKDEHKNQKMREDMSVRLLPHLEKNKEKIMKYLNIID
jgi:GT2 family glycosyltransferase